MAIFIAPTPALPSFILPAAASSDRMPTSSPTVPAAARPVAPRTSDATTKESDELKVYPNVA